MSYGRKENPVDEKTERGNNGLSYRFAYIKKTTELL